MKRTFELKLWRALRLTICVLVAGGTWSSAADARTIALSGNYVEENPGLVLPFAPDSTTLCTVDANNTSLERCTLIGGTATVTGTWMGQNLTSATFTYNGTTDEFTGIYRETFTGTSDHVGFGQVLSMGTFKATSTTFRADARIVGGTEDFAGSRGHITWTGNSAGNVTGTYSGTWVLPGGAGEENRASDRGQPQRHSRRRDRHHKHHNRRRHHHHAVPGASNKGGATVVDVNTSWDGTLDFSDPFEGQCSDPASGCQHYTGKVTFDSGTLQGSTAFIEGNGSAQSDGAYHFTETWTVTGTVASCSSSPGSFKFTETGDETFDPNNPNPSSPAETTGSASWQLIAGSGSGGLSGLLSGGGQDKFHTRAEDRSSLVPFSSTYGTTTGSLSCRVGKAK